MKRFFLAAAIFSTLLLSPGVSRAESAEVGSPAPAFSLKDGTGAEVKLKDSLGKYVVLEWVNFECPFVKKHYDSGNMQRLQEEMTKDGVVWYSVNSSAPGRQGYLVPEDAVRLPKEKGAHPTGVLLDEEGTVGKLYGAKTTPHMYLIDPKGTLVYAGAIDDKPSTEKEDVASAKNYLKAAYEEAKAGKPVTTASTAPYGCGVKYAS